MKLYGILKSRTAFAVHYESPKESVENRASVFLFAFVFWKLRNARLYGYFVQASVKWAWLVCYTDTDREHSLVETGLPLQQNKSPHWPSCVRAQILANSSTVTMCVN